MKLKIFLTTLMLLFAGCGQQEVQDKDKNTPKEETDTEKLRKTILALQGLQTQIDGLVNSDYRTCAGTPTDGGSTDNPLVQKICQIAQAATVEGDTEVKGQLTGVIEQLRESLFSQLDRVDAELTTLQASAADGTEALTILYGSGASCAAPQAGTLCDKVNTLETAVDDLQDDVADMQADITDLEDAVADLEAAIDDLQDQIDDLSDIINGAVAGMMLEVTIGNENASAGPLYESVLRKQDRSRINAYLEDVDANDALGNNPMQASNGSPTVTVTLTSHGFTTGNIVQFFGLASGRGFSAAAVNDQYVITVTGVNTFTITMPNNASSNGSLGGSVGYLKRINGRGLGQAWVTADGEVLTQTTFSTKRYNFVITGGSTTFTAAPTGAALPLGWAGLTPGAGFICYSKTSQTASAATIKAGGANIVCK